MIRYLMAVCLLITLMLLVFFAVETAEIPILTAPVPWLKQGGLFAGVLGVALLIADVAIPVPASVVMVAHGAAFGVLLGASLSVVGGLGASLVGFAIGRKGGRVLARFVSPDEQERANQLFIRWGTLAVVATRPIPVLAEVVAILAGTTTLGWGKYTIAALVGLLPGALMYALAGAAASSLGSPAVLLLALLLAVVFWLGGRLWRVKQAGQASDSIRTSC